MAAKPGWKARVRVPGVPVTFTNEGATDTTGARTTYQITNAAKRVFDATAAITAQTSSDGVTWTGRAGTLNRLTGTIVFNPALAAGTTVRFAAGSYLPLTAVAGATGYDYRTTVEILDASDFESLSASGGWRTNMIGLYDVSGTLTLLDQRDPYLDNALLNASLIVLEFTSDRTSGAAPDMLAWAMIESSGTSVALRALNTRSVAWSGVRDADNRIVSG